MRKIIYILLFSIFILSQQLEISFASNQNPTAPTVVELNKEVDFTKLQLTPQSESIFEGKKIYLRSFDRPFVNIGIVEREDSWNRIIRLKR
ncbi:MAG: hypothetical protein HQK53_04495 [Oligoflexia bacterium]|nr:hypothetical protein [Oligoflexia bacterium]